MEKPWFQHYEEGVPHSLEYPATTLHEMQDRTAEEYPDNTATVFLGSKLTFRELNALTDRFAAALHDLGVRKGDRVSLLLPNCPQFLMAYYAALKLGAVVVATSPLYSPREAQHQLIDAGAETIIVLSRLYPLVQAVRDATPLKRVIVTNIKEYFPPVTKVLFTLFREKKDGHRVEIQPGDHWLQDLISSHTPDQRPTVEVSPDDLAILQYTGGTTGVPKGAMASHRALMANTVQMRSWLTDLKQGEEVSLACIPLFHVYGMVAVMNLAVSIAAAIVLIPQPTVRREEDGKEVVQLHPDVLKAINQYRPTIFIGVPTLYNLVIHDPERPNYDIRSIRACISGSAPLPVEVKQQFEDLTGGRLVEGYGLSEAPTASFCNPIYGKNVPGSIGLPFPDVEPKIVDLETGEKEVPTGEEGELTFKAPNLMEGYWNMPEETQAAIRDGFLFTGDIAKMDDDGYVYIVDRKKDMVIVSGFNVYPREVEDVLYEHPSVLEAAVAGVPDPVRGEAVKAWIVPKPGETVTAEEVIDFCRDKLAKYKIPQSVDFREGLPKTLVGKVLRRYLVEEELEGERESEDAPAEV